MTFILYMKLSNLCATITLHHRKATCRDIIVKITYIKTFTPLFLNKFLIKDSYSATIFLLTIALLKVFAMNAKYNILLVMFGIEPKLFATLLYKYNLQYFSIIINVIYY